MALACVSEARAERRQLSVSFPATPRPSVFRRLRGARRRCVTEKWRLAYVRQSINFDPANVLGAMPEFDLFTGRDDLRVETNLACGEVGTQTMTLTSPAFAPNATGSQTVIFTRTAGTAHSLKEAEFEANVATADVPAGRYPVTVKCGPGAVGIGKVLVS